MAQFRTGCHSLEIEVGRHNKLNTEDRLCRYCGANNVTVVEDEYHVLFHCPAYKDIRNVYIGKETNVANVYNFVSVMTNKNIQDIVNLSHFIFNMFKIRKSL